MLTCKLITEDNIACKIFRRKRGDECFHEGKYRIAPERLGILLNFANISIEIFWHP